MKHHFLTHQFVKILVISFVLAMLPACGVSTDEGVPADTPTNIVDFSLTGNISAVGLTQRIDLPVQFNNERASSFFHISWDVESSDPYSITAFISTDANVTRSIDDQIFLQTDCGSADDYNCDSLGDQECALVYNPDYTYLLYPNGDRVLDIDGNPIRRTNPDGSFIAVDHYYIRCPHGPASIDYAEVTLRLASFPASSLTNYIVFNVCNAANNSCSATLTALQILDVDPTD